METQYIQYFIAAVVGLAVIILLLRRRAKKLKLRIEPVSDDRIDNTPIERNEIVSAVRVRAREQAVAKSAALNAELTRIEPTIDKSSTHNDDETVTTEAESSPAQPSSATAHEASSPLTFYPGYSAAANSAKPEETDTDVPAPEVAASKPVTALTQNDLFPDTDPIEPALGGMDGTDLAFDQVISIHVMARDEDIPGRLLLEHLLQYGLRYGDMAIFHRHEHPTGQGSILFSLAQAMEPGTFDIDTLARDSVPGVSLFLGLPGYKCLVAYDLMIDTARRLANVLHADMLDDNGQILTAGKLADWRDDVARYDARATSV